MADLDPPLSASCTPNIGPRERRKRQRFGVAMVVMSLGILAALALAGVSRSWRLFLFFPFLAASAGFFQAREKT